MTRASGKTTAVLHRRVKNQRLASVGYSWAGQHPRPGPEVALTAQLRSRHVSGLPHPPSDEAGQPDRRPEHAVGATEAARRGRGCWFDQAAAAVLDQASTVLPPSTRERWPA